MALLKALCWTLKFVIRISDSNKKPKLFAFDFCEVINDLDFD